MSRVCTFFVEGKLNIKDVYAEGTSKVRWNKTNNQGMRIKECDMLNCILNEKIGIKVFREDEWFTAGEDQGYFKNSRYELGKRSM